MKPLLTFAALFVVLSTSARNSPGVIDSLMQVLDQTFAQRERYIAAKQHKIDSMNTVFRSQGLAEADRYATAAALMNEYQSYIYDSAAHYAHYNLALAQKAGNDEWVCDSKTRLAHVLISGGLYTEAVRTLESIDRRILTGEFARRFYICFERLYHHMGMYADDDIYAPVYAARSGAYLDSLQRCTAPDSYGYKSLMARIHIRNGQVDSAKTVLREMISALPFGSHDYAMTTSTLAGAYALAPEGEERKKYLLLSAISDVMSAVNENESLRNLSELLYEENNLEAAYRYCVISMDDANTYNARLRRVENARTQPIIEKAYNGMIDLQHRKLRTSFMVISMLCLLTIGFLTLLWRQNRTIRKSRLSLLEMNGRLKVLNDSLVESNKVKEGYIGYFLSMCSVYINKLDRYRSMVFSRITAGKLDELKAMTRSTDLIDHEIREFYTNFDKAFLKLYPDFVAKFNLLLRDGEGIQPGMEELLNTELRIFALIRLGISDSSQIAKFLRYSPNTVYTYRTKVRNKAKNRAGFDAGLMEIG